MYYKTHNNHIALVIKMYIYQQRVFVLRDFRIITNESYLMGRISMSLSKYVCHIYSSGCYCGVQFIAFIGNLEVNINPKPRNGHTQSGFISGNYCDQQRGIISKNYCAFPWCFSRWYNYFVLKTHLCVFQMRNGRRNTLRNTVPY